MKVYEILPGQLYQRGTTLKIGRGLKASYLAQYGISFVVELWHRSDPDLLVMVHTVHYPIADGKSVDQLGLRQLAVDVVKRIHEGHRVLVTCHAGRNRSGLLSALIVRQLLRISGADALALVRERRPRAVANPAFAAFLEKLPPP